MELHWVGPHCRRDHSLPQFQRRKSGSLCESVGRANGFFTGSNPQGIGEGCPYPLRPCPGEAAHESGRRKSTEIWQNHLDARAAVHALRGLQDASESQSQADRFRRLGTVTCAPYTFCRLLVPVTALPALLATVSCGSHTWAAVALIAAFLVALLAVAGALWPSTRPMPRIVPLPAFAIAANVAVVHSIWRLGSGHNDHVWEPTLRTG